jgi:hypothetical protein
MTGQAKRLRQSEARKEGGESCDTHPIQIIKIKKHPITIGKINNNQITSSKYIKL